jgi:hypothetical protein
LFCFCLSVQAPGRKVSKNTTPAVDDAVLTVSGATSFFVADLSLGVVTGNAGELSTDCKLELC